MDEAEGRWTGSDGVGGGWRIGGAGRERGKRWKRKERRLYHDITPFLCCYISEQHGSSLMSGVVQGGWSGGRRGVQGVRVSEVELLNHCWGMDFSVGEPHVVRVRPANELDQIP